MMVPNLNPATIQRILALFSQLVEGIEKMSQKISDSIDNLVDQSIEPATKVELPKVVVEKKQFVTLDDIRNIAQAHRANGSNGVAAAIKQGKNKNNDDIVQLYLTYIKDRTIIDNKDNTLIVISAEAVSNEVKNLFGENEVIIIK